MPDVGGPNRWPDWCMGYQPFSPASEPRLRVIVDFRFRAEQFAEAAEQLTGIPMEAWRDRAGRWSVSPKESN